MAKFLEYDVNSFTPFGVRKGQMDLELNIDSLFARVEIGDDETLLAGDPVTLIQTEGELPRVKKSAAGEEVWGFVKWNTKRNIHRNNDIVSVAMSTDIMWMEANAAITAGSAITVADLTNVRVATATANIVGYAVDFASAQGDAIRVRIATPATLAAGS